MNSAGTGISRDKLTNTIPAEAMAPCAIRSSAVTVLTVQNKHVPVFQVSQLIENEITFLKFFGLVQRDKDKKI